MPVSVHGQSWGNVNEEVIVGIELEEEACEVDEDEDDQGITAEPKKIRCFKIAINPAVQPFTLMGDQSDGDCHQGRIRLGGHGLEFLRMEPESINWGKKQKLNTQDEQKIAEQTTEKGALDEVKVAPSESDPGNDKLDNIPQAHVQQSTDRLTSPQCDLFGSESQETAHGQARMLEHQAVKPVLRDRRGSIRGEITTVVSVGLGGLNAFARVTRFTEEADQQRALIEMHGLYCFPHPMRISPATTKRKGQQATVPVFPVPTQYASLDLQTTLSLPLMPTPMMTKGISGLLAMSSTPTSGSSNYRGPRLPSSHLYLVLSILT
ncbi:hypothetical protein BDM02DRAFT_3223291 [Thelephora ganbajun]|uniref:Uncharacterized protein n=1 Tax=Thelephora ganbajun TaxID=370292 RepID=A0ACB6Z1U2_THEGA|nr:hypothetical protein BDM02DRAFT_3223291 [Thelephora ganbajun]